MKTALIFGITGQDGSYLAEELLSHNYKVYGFIRRSSTGNTKNISHIINDITLLKGDLSDVTSIYRAISTSRADEIYNEADQDHVGWSFDSVGYSCDITGKAVGDILEIIRQTSPKSRYFQPLTSHMFGQTEASPQNEEHPFNPQSPYAAAKVLAYSLVKFYRNAYNVFASSAFFYNHTSPRKNDEYAINKIVNSAYRISKGQQKVLTMGNIDVCVDYGHAYDYMKAARNILQLDTPDDFTIGSGKAASLREILEITFKKFNLNYADYIEHSADWDRPTSNGPLIADVTKAKKTFGFGTQYDIEKIIDELIDHAHSSY